MFTKKAIDETNEINGYKDIYIHIYFFFLFNFWAFLSPPNGIEIIACVVEQNLPRIWQVEYRLGTKSAIAQWQGLLTLDTFDAQKIPLSFHRRVIS